MADEAGTSDPSSMEIAPGNVADATDCDEPEPKKFKIWRPSCEADIKLEERLNGILRCTVCLDLPKVMMYQCCNGHLMCAGCFSHLLADARLKDESATCPNCRCEISKSQCSRNLAVEKAVAELPAQCQYCTQELPRNILDMHEKELCQERLTNCNYERIGCPWKGPFHELKEHTEQCAHPKKTGLELMEYLETLEKKQKEEKQIYDKIFNMLSFEKIQFIDLQLRPFRTDDFLTKLFYETARFSAFNSQWVVKGRVNDDMKSPNSATTRYLSYQLILKSRIQNPLDVHYVCVQGPFGDAKISPALYKHQFTADQHESQYQVFPIGDSSDCNKLLAAKTINFRLIMMQIQG